MRTVQLEPVTVQLEPVTVQQDSRQTVDSLDRVRSPSRRFR